MAPIERETRRRIWNACVQLDASICVTIGFSSALSPAQCISVEPALVDDDYLDASGAHQPIDRPSSLAFFAESSKLFGLQVEVLNRLYTSRDTSAAQVPDTQSILDLDRDLARWRSALPVHLLMSAEGALARAGRADLEAQVVVLEATCAELSCLQ